MKLVKTAASVFSLQIISTVSQALGLVYFAQELGANQLGVFVLFQALLTMFRFVANAGVDQALEKRISEGDSENVVGSSILIKGVIIILIAALVVATRGYLNEYMGSSLALLLLAVLIPQQLARVVLKTLRGELRVREATVLKMLRNVLFIGCGSALVYLGEEVYGLIVALIVSWSIVFILGTFKITTSLGLPTTDAVQSLITYSKYNLVASVIGGYMYNWLDTVVIGLFLTQSHVAAYEVAWRIAGVVMLLSRSIASTIFPQVSDWDVKDKQEKISNILPSAVTGSLLLVFPAIIGGAILNTELLQYLFGPEFVIASSVLIVLLAAKIPEGAHAIFGQVLLGVDRPDLVARAVSAFIVINVVLNVVLINAIGLVGAAIATGISFTINAGLTVYYLRTLMTISINWKDILGSVFASLGMGILLHGIQLVLPVESVATLLIMVAIGGVIYLSLLLTIPNMRRRFTTVTSSIRY